MKPIISIIVPIYNVEKYLPKCIESILNQNFKEFELILVDDGSPDRSGDICDKYASKDNRIKVIHKKNGGVSSARNAGLKAAIGDYIGFVDPDDYIDENMYKKLYELCKENYCDIGICRFNREINGKLTGKEIEDKIVTLNNMDAMRELFKGELYRFSLCNKLFKRKCFNNVVFPEGRIHEDLSTTYKLFANSSKSVYTPYLGYIYVKRENSILTSVYSEKRLQSLIGWEEIIEFMSISYSEIIDQVIATFTYWCMDNVTYILKQVDNKKSVKSYLNTIRGYTKKYYLYIRKNKVLTLKYKFIVFTLNFHSDLLILKNKLSTI